MVVLPRVVCAILCVSAVSTDASCESTGKCNAAGASSLVQTTSGTSKTSALVQDSLNEDPTDVMSKAAGNTNKAAAKATAKAAKAFVKALKTSPIAGVLQAGKKPKIVLGQDVDWPPYAYIGTPPESDHDVAGIGHDIAMGLGELCNWDVETVQTPWADCWDGGGKPWPKIGAGLEEGRYHGCMTYTHPAGMRGRFLEWSYAILKKNKPAGLLTLLNSDGKPKISPNTTLDGLKVVDVAGWAPLSDGLDFSDNKCTRKKFEGFKIVKPTDEHGNIVQGNDAAMKMLRDGKADAMWVYADQAHNYECTADGSSHSGATPTWDCSLWKNFGKDYAYIASGMLGYMINGTTLTISRKGSGLPEFINPCLQKFMETKAYYDICTKHGVENSCFPNKYFPDALIQGTRSDTNPWDKPTNEQDPGCGNGYCGCQDSEVDHLPHLGA